MLTSRGLQFPDDVPVMADFEVLDNSIFGPWKLSLQGGTERGVEVCFSNTSLERLFIPLQSGQSNQIKLAELLRKTGIVPKSVF